MSVTRNRFIAVQYRTGWSIKMDSWYRQVLSLVYGLGVMAIAMWALRQGSGPTVVLGVVGMSMLTLMLIFGVEIDEIRVLDKVQITFAEDDEPDE